MSHNGKPNGMDAWLNFEAAILHTGRSRATLKRAVSSGKIAKRVAPAPGRPREVQLSREDLERVFGAPVQYMPVPVGSREPRHEPNEPMALIPASLAGIAPVIERVNAWLEAQALAGKLCWTLAQAKEMTGLSRPALRELAAAHPECVIRRGRRVWFKAGKLREVLG